jgi:hypothetical protein
MIGKMYNGSFLSRSLLNLSHFRFLGSFFTFSVGPRIDRLSIRGIHFETKRIEEKGAFEIEVSALLNESKSGLSYVSFCLSLYSNWII